LAYGLGLRATRAPRDTRRGIPGHIPTSPLYVEPPLDAVTGYPDAVSCMDAGYPVHVWGCRCIPGTMTCRRFKDRMISKISEIDREHPWTTRQLFNSITLGHNNDPTLQIISWEGFCQA
jgi:hypothetical protein